MNSNVDILGFFWSLIEPLLEPIFNFFVGFLPDGDPAIYSIIDRIGDVGGANTFNVFYFVDWSAVLLCFGVLVSVALLVQVLKLVFRGVDFADRAIELIPFYE